MSGTSSCFEFDGLDCLDFAFAAKVVVTGEVFTLQALAFVLGNRALRRPRRCIAAPV